MNGTLRTTTFAFIAAALTACASSDSGSTPGDVGPGGSGGSGQTAPGATAPAVGEPGTAAAGDACLAAALLAPLGKSELLVGFSGADDVSGAARWDLRYQYIASPLGDPAAGCQAGSTWWGCWQDPTLPPGRFASDFAGDAAASGQIPMFTYYMMLPASGAAEGAAEVRAANDAAFLGRYLADFRFLLERIGTSRAFLHLEPDFWGYAQQLNADPRAIPAPVAAANPVDCADQESSVAGLGRCMVAMTRKYAPNVRVGLHASAWGTGIDAAHNASPDLDVVGEAREVGRFLREAGGAESDFVVVEMSDRDAGYFESVGRATWWDPSNARLPSFRQHLAWAKAVAETVGKPAIWWQVPVGNESLPDAPTVWRDNRVDYFFDHPEEFAAAHGAGIAFGAGDGGGTTPSTDGGNLARRAAAYFAAGGTPACR